MKRPIFWRRWLIGLAFRLDHASVLSKICWRLSRALATENTHMLLASYVSGLYMLAITRGEM